LDKTVKFWNFNKSNSKKEDNGQSNELIHSINFNFSIHSIFCDPQNVFYTMGAFKNSSIEANNKQKPTIVQENNSVKIENIETNGNQSKNQPKKKNQTTHTTPSQMVTRHSSASNQQTINTNSNLSNTTSSTILFNNDDDLYEV
jgi:hypothetical protein